MIGYADLTIDAASLLAKDFPAPRWAVPGLLPEGLTLLAGAPKVGKSWLLLDLALAVASGGRALDSIDVQAGEVLYLALEDSPRRLQSRLAALLDHGEPAPPGLHIARTWPRGDEAAALVCSWLEDHPGARLVIVDVLAKVRAVERGQTPPYERDYAALGPLKAAADKYGVAVVVVHHTRKADAEDWMDALSGTNGLAGSADTIALLRRARGQADGVLHMTGRDVEELQLALRQVGPRWLLTDLPPQVADLGDLSASVVTYVNAHPDGVRVAEVAAGLGMEPRKARTYLDRLAGADRIARTAPGEYRPFSFVSCVSVSHPAPPVTHADTGDTDPLWGSP